MADGRIEFLLVEDNEHDITAIRRAWKSAGHASHGASHGFRDLWFHAYLGTNDPRHKFIFFQIVI
jgi:hypothetical protein